MSRASSSNDKIQKWWDGSGFPLPKFVKNVQRSYSNMNFLRDVQTGMASTKMKIMIC